MAISVVAVGDSFLFGFKLQVVLLADLVTVVAVEQRLLPVHFPNRKRIPDTILQDIGFKLVEFIKPSSRLLASRTRLEHKQRTMD
jgi:hypothetical protein